MPRACCVIILGLLGGAAAVSAVPASQPAPATRATTEPASLATLRKIAEGPKVAEALAALRHLSAAGDEQGVRMAAPLILARDAAVIKDEAAAVGAALPKIRAAEKEMAEVRAAALDGIAKLTKTAEALAAAREKYDHLTALRGRLGAEYPRQLRLTDFSLRRAECLTLWRAADHTAPPADGPTVVAEDARLAKLIEEAIGMPAEAAAAFATGPLTPPAEPDRRGLWLFAASRRIEAYNKTLESYMNAAEVAHVKKLNGYREMLGLLPYEIDVRLIQSARRHSKEMFDLKYFSHWSPNEGMRSCWERMAQAGYARGTSENITLGAWTGDEAFWHLFSSPPHHRDWVRPWETALGVGKWENAWTENMGALPRLMLADQAQRERAVIVGDPLEPQKVETTRKNPRNLEDYKFYDQMGIEVGSAKFKPGPAPARGK